MSSAANSNPRAFGTYTPTNPFSFNSNSPYSLDVLSTYYVSGIVPYNGAHSRLNETQSLPSGHLESKAINLHRVQSRNKQSANKGKKCCLPWAGIKKGFVDTRMLERDPSNKSWEAQRWKWKRNMTSERKKRGAHVTRPASSSAGLTDRGQNGRQIRAPQSSLLWYVWSDPRGKSRGASLGAPGVIQR